MQSLLRIEIEKPILHHFFEQSLVIKRIHLINCKQVFM